MVCYVASTNPPLHVIDGCIWKVWKDQDIDKISMVNTGVFLVRFKTKEDQEKAYNMNGDSLITNHS